MLKTALLAMCAFTLLATGYLSLSLAILLPLLRTRRRARRVGFDVVVVQHGVEQQVELAEILPPVTRIPRKQTHAALAARLIDDGRAVADLVGAAHHPAQHVLVAARISHEDALRRRHRPAAALGSLRRSPAAAARRLHAQQRTIAVSHRDRP